MLAKITQTFQGSKKIVVKECECGANERVASTQN